MMLNYIGLAVLVGLLIAGGWHLRRRLRRGRYMPAISPRPDRTTRVAETAIMGLAALLILFLLSFDYNRTGVLFA